MSTLGHFLERLRRDLGDTDPANAVWSTDALERHLQHALAGVSGAVPRQMLTTLTATPHSRTLDVSGLTQRLAIVAVEWPVGEYPPEYVRFSLWQDTLTLLVASPPSGADPVNVSWHALHTLDPAGTTLPAWAEDLLVAGAAGYAAQEMIASTAGAVTVSIDALRHYQHLAGGLKDFRAELRRRSARGSLRTARLYVPDRPILTQTTDPGP